MSGDIAPPAGTPLSLRARINPVLLILVGCGLGWIFHVWFGVRLGSAEPEFHPFFRAMAIVFIVAGASIAILAERKRLIAVLFCLGALLGFWTGWIAGMEPTGRVLAIMIPVFCVLWLLPGAKRPTPSPYDESESA